MLRVKALSLWVGKLTNRRSKGRTVAGRFDKLSDRVSKRQREKNILDGSLSFLYDGHTSLSAMGRTAGT
jgi:hypothetical protein